MPCDLFIKMHFHFVTAQIYLYAGRHQDGEILLKVTFLFISFQRTDLISKLNNIFVISFH